MLNTNFKNWKEAHRKLRQESSIFIRQKQLPVWNLYSPKCTLHIIIYFERKESRWTGVVGAEFLELPQLLPGATCWVLDQLGGCFANGEPLLGHFAGLEKGGPELKHR